MTWNELIEQYEKENFESYHKLLEFVRKERISGKRIYPEDDKVYRALKLAPFEKVKVVIFGQDPYLYEKQADGLAFSVPSGVRKPPSLKNIFRELKKDLDIDEPKNGDLSGWGKQGVLLLNLILTIEHGKRLSHGWKGWEGLTTFLIRKLAEDKKPKVFMIWGKKFSSLLPDSYFGPHCLVLKCGHPSPQSYLHFMDNHHFSIANNFLVSKGLTPIDWRLRGE